MTPEEETLAMKVYLPLMDEIVARIDVVNVCARNEPNFAPGLVRELCYLQFRAICELVAVGCVALYGHHKLPRRVVKTYEAPKVINELKALDPNCFPSPVVITRNGKHVSITATQGTDHLSRDELVSLWNKSGEILHRAPYTKVTRAQDPKLADLSDIGLWGQKIAALLSNHYVMVDPTKIMTVALKDIETGLPSANFLALSLSDGTAATSLHRLEK